MGENGTSKRRQWRWRSGICLGLVLACGLLLFPERSAPPVRDAGKEPFAWNLDRLWSALERDFVHARGLEKGLLNHEVVRLLAETRATLSGLAGASVHDPGWSQLETNLFRLAPLVAAGGARLAEFIGLVNDIRTEVKERSAAWDMSSDPVRERLYRLFCASRMAVEEVLLQNRAAGFEAGPGCHAEPSQTACTVFRGAVLHSGDILVSRGGAPTSALISRGNDFAGMFSHVALLHVDPETGEACVIQALLEKGVVVTPLQEYERDRKLRLMVLRARADLPAMAADPQLPHKAAASLLQEALARHIPYDFTMDYRDHSAMFCSEVAAAAYELFGIRLWKGMTHMSSPTLRAWLGSLGARHFETQAPADLEYDPQLRVVAEWRDRHGVWQAHLDDAVTDVMLERAKPGQPLPFNRFKLPFARVAKGYSALLNWLGGIGPIPEGMSATTALRADQYRAGHAAIKWRLTGLAGAFEERHGYSPPYWELVRLAGQAWAGVER